MKNYDFDLAKQIIEKFNSLGVLETASLGMHEDWFWTGETIWENGVYIKELPSNHKELYKEYHEKRQSGMSIFSDEYKKYDCIMIAGIYASDWATPVIQLDLTNGDTETFDCYNGEWTSTMEERFQKMTQWTGGAISSEVQNKRDEIDIKKFQNN